MATFPAELAAKIQRQGYRESPADLTIRSSMDTGPDKVRRRSTAGVRLISFPLFLTDDELEVLDTFYVTTTNGGSNSFDFVSKRTGATLDVRFTAPPEYNLDQTMWNVPISLEILP